MHKQDYIDYRVWNVLGPHVLWKVETDIDRTFYVVGVESNTLLHLETAIMDLLRGPTGKTSLSIQGTKPKVISTEMVARFCANSYRQLGFVSDES